MREAHPGERVPHHTSREQKIAHARLFRDRWNSRRPILVDDLDGPVHRAYGMLPNMTYIVTPAGRVAFRADWTDAHTIAWVLDYLAHERDERKTLRRVAPFFVELPGHRSALNYPRVFLEGLASAGGSRAVEEYITAVGHQRSALDADHMRRVWATPRAEAGRSDAESVS